MESFVVECCEAWEFACRDGAGKTRTGYTSARQGGAGEEEHARFCALCSCGFDAQQHESRSCEIQFIVDRYKENSSEKEAKSSAQIEMKSCLTGYPTKKITCYR
jgi:hypothetical protein